MDTFLGLPGLHWAIIGATFASVGGGIGSVMGISYVNNVATGILVEDPEKFGGVLPLCVLPGTQGIYGFITAVMVVLFYGLLAGGGTKIDGVTGFQIFLACQPVCWNCLVSAIYQGFSAVAAAGMVAKRMEEAGKALVFPVLVETYAALSLIISILLLLSIKTGAGL
ncbi:MAG: V-type ATP synthase subunit K [Candidatus Subteraquimicrobiales bacterium]|nr:V-type ATP synthase subunit K [Candidatus Subteraquimicrobiales bacterium]